MAHGGGVLTEEATNNISLYPARHNSKDYNLRMKTMLDKNLKICSL